MTGRLLALVFFLPLFINAQHEFNNKGAEIYIQKGALIHVQGNFVNDNNTTNGLVRNDGVIEVKGNFDNKTNASFQTFNDNTSTERAVKFIGSGTQAIKGNMNNSSFYNLVIDKASSSDTLELQTAIQVDGSLIFGTPNTSATYNPALPYTSNNQKGFLKTYFNSDEFLVSVTNGNTDAIVGYPALAMNTSPATGFVLTKGTRGSSDGGLRRNVTSTTAYDFPIGTVENGYNAVRLTFQNIPSNGGGFVKGKFNDGSDNPSGAAGALAQECTGCGTYPPDNNGYNRYFPNNPCNSNNPQWLVLEDAVLDHGYWSFAADDNNSQFSYMVEVFPNSYMLLGSPVDIMRTLKFEAAYGYNPSSAVWNSFIDSASSINDLLQYSRNGGCYMGQGIPGGIYTGLAHFSFKSAMSGGALPVELLYLHAEPALASINVSWATAIEINNQGFEVLRSTDGANFASIGWVNGSNNSTVIQQYLFQDVNVVPNTIYYYKLSIVDNDGTREETQIVSAVIRGEDELVIGELMPNPSSVASQIVISSSKPQLLSVKLVDMIGREVSSINYQLSAGQNPLSLNLNTLSSGAYHVMFSVGDKHFSKRLVVTN